MPLPARPADVRGAAAPKLPCDMPRQASWPHGNPGPRAAPIAKPDRAITLQRLTPRRAGLIGISYGRVGVLFDLQLVGPAPLDRVAQPMQRADAGIAAPRKHELLGTTHADHLIVDQIRRHADQRQIFQLLTNDLVAVACGMR